MTVGKWIFDIWAWCWLANLLISMYILWPLSFRKVKSKGFMKEIDEGDGILMLGACTVGALFGPLTTFCLLCRCAMLVVEIYRKKVG
ncbi:MAG: hypothetical protein ACTSPB_26080 [Candidatus Thorarchaeota archaeon]